MIYFKPDKFVVVKDGAYWSGTNVGWSTHLPLIWVWDEVNYAKYWLSHNTYPHSARVVSTNVINHYFKMFDNNKNLLGDLLRMWKTDHFAFIRGNDVEVSQG